MASVSAALLIAAVGWNIRLDVVGRQEEIVLPHFQFRLGPALPGAVLVLCHLVG